MEDTKATIYVCPNCNSTFNYVPSECHFCGRISKTNADRIRSMSDEELAEYLLSVYEDGNRDYYVPSIEWLKQEVE